MTYIPRLPIILSVSRKLRDSDLIRSFLIVSDERVKPLLSWYTPNEKTWIPHNWFKETKMNLTYYIKSSS